VTEGVAFHRSGSAVGNQQAASPALGAVGAARMGYELEVVPKTSGPINAIFFDRAHKTMWGGSSNHGEDYGIGW
jgi:gamma-glutamyltranspeptidase/glutathione hydrolase